MTRGAGRGYVRGMRRSRILQLVCATAVWCGACAPAVDPGGEAPRVYWDVRNLGAGFAKVSEGELPFNPRFVTDDVVAGSDPSGALRIADVKSRASKLLPFPEVPADGFTLGLPNVTWFQDERNFGGSSTGGGGNTLNGGYVVVDGKLHECEGDICTPVFRNADGSFVTRTWNGLYFATWKPGQNPAAAHPVIDDLDVHDYRLDMVMPCFAVRKVSDAGLIQLAWSINGALRCFNAPVQINALVKDFVKTELAALDPMNRAGDFLVNVDGIPGIAKGDTFQPITTQPGLGFAFNARGDAIYRASEEAGLRMRLGGNIVTFPDCEVGKQLGGDASPFTAHVLDMNERGEVLFWTAENGTSLFIAKPRTAPVLDGVVARLSFTAKTEGATAPAPLEGAWRVTGSLQDGSLTFEAPFPTADACADRRFVALATRTGGAWAAGDVVSMVSGQGGSIVGTASFSTPEGTVFLAKAGGFKLRDVSAAGFTATAEGLVFVNQATREEFDASGEFRVESK